MHGIREELTRLYELPKGTGIILTPSGADAQYIPILVSKALNAHKNEKFLNILTGKGEIGSTTVRAAAGKYLS